jgi:hypothetical protein
MLIIKNFTNWLTESAGLVTEVTTPAAVKTLRADIVAGAPFNKWTVSKTYPAVMFNPKWKMDPDKSGWRIEISAYMFQAGSTGATISAVPHLEELVTAIPTTDPCMKKANGFNIEGNQPPTALPKGTTIYSPSEATANQTFKMIAGNKQYSQTTSFIPEVTTAGHRWGLLNMAIPPPTGENLPVEDAYSAYNKIAGEDPSVTVDTYLGILNTAVANASAIMAKQVKSGTVAGQPIKTLKNNGFTLSQALVDKVKTLAPAVPVAPVVKPG